MLTIGSQLAAADISRSTAALPQKVGGRAADEQQEASTCRFRRTAEQHYELASLIERHTPFLSFRLDAASLRKGKTKGSCSPQRAWRFLESEESSELAGQGRLFLSLLKHWILCLSEGCTLRGSKGFASL